MTDLKFVGVNATSGETEQKQADPGSDALLMNRFKPSGGQAGPLVVEPVTQVTANSDVLIVEDGNGAQLVVVKATAGVAAATISGDLVVSNDFAVVESASFGTGPTDTFVLARAWSNNGADFDYAASATLTPTTAPTFGAGTSLDILVGTGTADPDVNGVTASEGSLLLVTDGTAWVKTGAGDTAWTQLATSNLNTLEGVLTGGTPDNDVNIPLADPIVYRDNAVDGFDLHTYEKTAAGSNDAIAIVMAVGAIGGAAIDIDIAGAAQGVTIDSTISTNPLMTLTKSGGSGIGMVIDVNAIATGRGMNITHGATGSGISMSNGTNATLYNATGVNPLIDYEVRPTRSGAGVGYDLTLSGGTSGVGIGDSGGDLLLIGGNGNTFGVDGDVLIGNLTTTANVTIAPAAAVTVQAGTPAAGTGSTGSSVIISVGTGAAALAGTGAGPGGSLLLVGGNGGASDGIDAANNGGSTIASSGDGGDGLGNVDPANGGSFTANSGAGGNVGASGNGADGGDFDIIAGDGSDGVNGDGGSGGNISIVAGTSGDGAGGGNGTAGGSCNIVSGDGGAGAIPGGGGHIRLETGSAGAATATTGEIRLAVPKQDGDTTPAFKYAEAATISPTGAGSLTAGIALYAVSDDPNNEVTAIAGSLALDDSGKVWVNTDFTNTGWDELLTIASGSPSLDDAITSAGAVDNDVDISVNDPIIFNDAAVAGFDLLTLNRTGVGSGDALVINMGPGGEATTGSGISIIDGSASDGSPLSITHKAFNTSAAIQVDAGQFHAEYALRVDQTAPTPVFSSYGLLGIRFGGYGSFTEFNILGQAPTTIGTHGRDIRMQAAPGATGDGGTPAGSGGDVWMYAGGAGADAGGGGTPDGGALIIRAGAGTGAGSNGSISIGETVAADTFAIGMVGGGVSSLWIDEVTGSAGDPEVVLSDTDSLTAGSYGVGTNTGTFVNIAPNNPDLQTVLETLDGAIGGGGTLQSNYGVGNTIAVTAARPIAFSNAVDDTALLTIDRTFVGAGNGVSVTMGEPGDEAVTGIGVSIVSGTGATGDMLFVNNQGSGEAIRIQDGGGDVFVVANNGFVGISPTSGQNLQVLLGGTSDFVVITELTGGITMAAGTGNITLSAQTATAAVEIETRTSAAGTGGDLTLQSIATNAAATSGDVLVGAIATTGTAGGVEIRAGGTAFTAPTAGEVSLISEALNITFDANGAVSPIPFNASGADANLVGFTATSVIGALNELVGGGGGIPGSLTLGLNETVTTVSPGPLVIGGGVLDGADFTTRTLTLLGRYTATGTTGDCTLRLFDVGSPGSPVARVLRSDVTIPFASAGSLDSFTVTLTAVTSPGVNADAIHDITRNYEIEIEIVGSDGLSDIFQLHKASIEVT